ncbi:MAG: PQQ-binding-like beta-propeller repeat protein [Acidobacteriota bacterium]
MGRDAVRRTVAACLTAALVAAPAFADWLGLRGDGTGRSDEVDLPLTWDETAGDTAAIAWKTPLPGRGHSSPVVVGGHVFLTTAYGDARDPVAETRDAAPSLRLLVIDLATGALLHDLELFDPDAWQADHPDNGYASPTPAANADGHRLCVHFGTYGTSCLALDVEAAEPPQILFRGQPFPQEHEVGPGSSPVIWQDRMIVLCDATDSQYVAALEVETGDLLWRLDRRDTAARKPPHRKAFSTPLVFRYGPHWRVLATGATGTSAIDPTTGEELWWIRHEGYSNVPMPVVGLGHAFVNTGYMKPHLLAVRLGGSGDVGDTHLAWSYHWQVSANPTPLLIDRRLFMVSDWGIASWLDPLRGDDLWRHRLKGKFRASPLFADGRIYTWSVDGETVVIEPGDAYHELARNRLDGAIRATPAISDGSIVVRTDRHLVRLRRPRP